MLGHIEEIEDDAGVHEPEKTVFEEAADAGFYTESPVEEEKPPYDPFDGNGTQVATLITVMRIYDVLMAQLAESDDELADALSRKHAAGQLVLDLPSLAI